MLHQWTRGKGEPVVLVHGFTQTHSSWGAIAGLLAERRQVTAVDAPGHGRSSAVAAGIWAGAALIGQVGGRATYLGYSMGARLVLCLALERPDLVERLVLVSATAGIDDPSQRVARREADERLAERVESQGVEAFVRWWLSQPMWATLPAEAAEGAERLGSSAEGLASSLRLAGQGQLDPPLWDRLGQMAMPVLVIAGALDGPYAERARRLAAAIPGATLALVPGAGHACHLERPDAVWEVLEPWLDAHPVAHSASPTTRRAP